MDWITVAIQAGGAIGVCGMFILFLLKKQVADDTARDNFLQHLESKDQAMSTAIDKQMSYLRERDAQSKEIAMSGHDALREITREVSVMRATLDNPR